MNTCEARTRKDRDMNKLITSTWLALLLAMCVLQSGCGYVAAGAAGAVIGHEAAEEDDEDDE
jgi:hypothetical protein